MRLLLLAVTLVCLPGATWAEQTIQIVYGESYKPFAWGVDGKAYGVQPEFVEAVLGGKLGLNVVHQALPWKRAQLLVEQGERDGFFTVPTPVRAKYTEHPATPLYETHFVMHTSVTNPKLAELKAIQSLRDLEARPDIKHVHMLGSGWHEQALKRMRTIYTIVDAGKIPIMLSSQRADVYIEQKELFRYQVRALNMEKEILTFERPSLGELGWYIFIGKRSRFIGLIPKLEEQLRVMQASGELLAIQQKLFKKYGAD